MFTFSSLLTPKLPLAANQGANQKVSSRLVAGAFVVSLSLRSHKWSSCPRFLFLFISKSKPLG